ncbi:MAG: hypothetical protein ACLFN8_00110 [Candidatus Woesearchaeota archaeon]
MVKCSISEFVVYNALKSINFEFFSKDNFINSKYNVFENNCNLKFFKEQIPKVEFDFFEKYEKDLTAIEVKSSEPTLNYDPFKALNFAKELTNSSTKLLILAPFKSEKNMHTYTAQLSCESIIPINLNLRDIFYEDLIRNFYSKSSNEKIISGNISFNDEISEILKEI